MKFNIQFIALIFGLALISCHPNKVVQATSPDKKIEVTVQLDEDKIYYQVDCEKQAIVNKSLLGFTLKEHPNLNGNFILKDIVHSSYSGSWDQIWGEEISVDEAYNELKIRVEEKGELKRQFFLVFRIFNDGFGFRYEFPEQKNLNEFVIMDELTEFALADDHTAWSIPYDIEAYEGLYRKTTVNQLDTVCTPLTLKTNDGLYLTIHEANLNDYAAMNLFPEDNNKLKVYLTPWSTGEKVFMKTPHNTPWRTMIIAKTPGDLMLSRLMLNLNEPCKIEETSWIEPGRYIGIWWGMHMKKYTWDQGPNHGATTENTKRYIDFAAKYNFSGVLVEGWNKGWSNWYNFSYTEAYPDFDLDEITQYGAQKGVRLIGHHETGGNVTNYEKQLEEAFALYNKHGVHAVKTGYVGTLLNGTEMHSGQFAVRHYRDLIEKGVAYKIMIDNHEPVMPTGLQRTYPNLMTQEGVRGQEWNAWANDGGNPPNHTTIIPFTRGLAGPIDFTPGIFNFENTAMPGTRVQTTLAKQLALFVVLYSPLQMAADMIENYEANIEPFEFITSCPVNWAKTLVPEAEIGEYVTVARKDRESDSWFVGSITNENEREMYLPLDFLDANTTYKAKIFKDGPEADYLSNPYPISIEEVSVTSDSILIIPQAKGGGTAVMITR